MGACTVQILHTTEQFIHCKVEDIAGNFEFLFTAVYGLHTIEDRKSLWNGLLF